MLEMGALEALKQGIELRLAEVDALPQGVQTWMMFMRSLFLSSIFFVIWKREARVVLAMVVANAILLFGFKAIFPEIHSAEIGRTIHLFLWTAVLIYLVRRHKELLAELRSGRVSSVIYGVWAIAVALVLAISLFFDFGTIIGRMVGGG